jgi:hypothetical protein
VGAEGGASKRRPGIAWLACSRSEVPLIVHTAFHFGTVYRSKHPYFICLSLSSVDVLPLISDLYHLDFGIEFSLLGALTCVRGEFILKFDNPYPEGKLPSVRPLILCILTQIMADEVTLLDYC